MAKTDGAALAAALADIEKQFGAGAVMRLGEASHNLQVEAIPTGSISLDVALGIGGIPRGRVSEIFGPESTGKSTLAQHVIAEAQRMGGQAAYIDVEHALDAAFARAIGIDIDELLIAQPDTGEQALEITETLVRSNALDVLVVDSVAALVPPVSSISALISAIGPKRPIPTDRCTRCGAPPTSATPGSTPPPYR